MECNRLSGGLWMSRHIFKVGFQLISLPAKVHLSVVGGVKRGCGGRESISHRCRLNLVGGRRGEIKVRRAARGRCDNPTPINKPGRAIVNKL